MNLPKAVKYTVTEGGEWHNWVPQTRSEGVNAILFDNGSVWDIYNGWRNSVYCPCCGTRNYYDGNI